MSLQHEVALRAEVAYRQAAVREYVLAQHRAAAALCCTVWGILAAWWRGRAPRRDGACAAGS